MRGKLLKKSIDITDNILSKFDHWTTSCVFNFLGVNYDLNGKYIRHNTKLNEVGMSVNGVNATMTFHSREFVRNNVPFVNAGGVIQLTNGAGAMITVEDEIATRVYNVCRVITDETLGIIVCELQLSNNNQITVMP